MDYPTTTSGSLENQTTTLTGDVTGSGIGSLAATIANGAVTLAKTTGTNLMKRGSWTSFEKLGTDTVTQAGGWA